jgi:hypothetical protein
VIDADVLFIMASQVLGAKTRPATNLEHTLEAIDRHCGNTLFEPPAP